MNGSNGGSGDERDAARPSRGPTVERRLTLKGVTAGIEAAWSSVGAQGEPFTVAPLLTVEDQVEHRWYIEESLRWRGPGDAARARVFEGRLEAIGRTLYKALRADGDVHPLAELARDGAASGAWDGGASGGGAGGGAAGGERRHRLFTIASTDATALSLPWELVRDGQSALLLREVILRRQLLTTTELPAIAVTLPLRILWIVSRPSDVGFIDPRSSLRPGLVALEALGSLVDVELCVPPTLAEVERRLDADRRAGRPFHLVHFDGHGVYLQHSGVGALCFEKADAKNDLVEGGRFGDLLARHHIPVALLEACQTADLSTSVFGSVAPALLRAGVGSVIAFSHAVTVSGARVLVRGLYEALCHGDTIGQALGAARSAMHANSVRLTTRAGETLSLVDWHIAQLYQAGADPVLVPGGTPTRPSAPRKTGRLAGEGFRIEPMYGFRGRARELLDLERKLRAHSAVLVKGMGGMGKTSLALEAGRWWTRTGQRAEGAMFTSFEARPSVEQVVRSIGVAFDGDGFLQRSEEQQRERAIELFRNKEVLWIWDNFESVLPQYQEGEDTSPTCATGGAADATVGNAAGNGKTAGARSSSFEVVTDEDRSKLGTLFRALVGNAAGVPKGWLVVTCRPSESGLAPIADMDLHGLSRPDALELAQEILSLKGVACDRPGYERGAIDALLAALDQHPLSIELVLPHLQTSPPADVQRDFGKLLDGFATQGAAEDRNKSLRASLAFSADRLGGEVKAVLPYLAWFEGGAFEDVLLAFTQWTPEKWGRARARLESVALVRADDAVRVADRPFLVFHPTLPYAARAEDVPEREAAGARFVAAYSGLAGDAHEALLGGNPAGGMGVVAREERNLRRAAAWAFGSERFDEAGVLAAVVGWYLESMSRPREQARWAAWAQRQMAAGPGNAARWAGEREYAWGLFLEGKLGEAVKLLEAQLAAIDAAGGDVRQRALTNGYLGRIWLHAREPDRSLAPHQAAIDGFEGCGDQANLAAVLGGSSGKSATPRSGKSATPRKE